jgi:hypothetical protein
VISTPEWRERILTISSPVYPVAPTIPTLILAFVLTFFIFWRQFLSIKNIVDKKRIIEAFASNVKK